MQAIRDPNLAAKVDILQDIKEGSWLELSQLARENIITAHQWSQSLAGLSVAGSLGTNQQIRAEFDIIQNTVIRPTQQNILGTWINKILPEIAEFIGKDFGKNELDLLNTTPISFAGDLDIMQIIEQDEAREALGLKPLNKDVTNGNTN